MLRTRLNLIPLLLYAFFFLQFSSRVHCASTNLKGFYNKKQQLSSTALLNWRIDEPSGKAFLALTITDPAKIKPNQPSYLGIGIGEPLAGSMLGSDIVTAEFKEGTENDARCNVTDRYTPFSPFPLTPGGGGADGVFPVPDTCGLSDWALVNCARDAEKGVLVFEVSRDLDNKNDTQDREIGPGEQQVMYAYGADFVYHGESRASIAMVLYGERESGLTEDQLRSGMKPEDVLEDVDFEQNITNARYNVPAKSTTYACTGTVLNVEGNTTIIGAEPVIQEGNENNVHHFLVYVCQNNAYFQNVNGKTRDCLGDGPLGSPEAACGGIVYGWAKGGVRIMFPRITGFEIDSKSKYIIVETHYDNPKGADNIVDSSGVKLFLTNKRREQPGGILVLGDGQVTYGGEKVESKRKYQYTCPSNCTSMLEKPLTVFGLGYHMHTTGRRIWTNQYDKNGQLIAKRESISFWSDSWQKFAPTKPWTINPGDALVTTGEFDTTKRPNTTWGLETVNEMMMEFLFVYPKPSLKPDGRTLYFCGVLAPEGQPLTMCSAASITNPIRDILPVPNPAFEDRVGLNDTFGNEPTVCRADDSSDDSPTSSSDENPTSTNSPASKGNEDAECFPSFATVELESGKTITMDTLAVGDRIKVSAGKFSKVYFFSHRDPYASSKFVEITASQRCHHDKNNAYKLTATRGHLIITSKGLVAAKEVKVGDALYNAEGELLQVDSIRYIESSGLYSPHTMDGDILVDGVRASSYSNYLPARLAHALLLPERLAHQLGFSIYGGESYISKTSRDSGRPLVVEYGYRALQLMKSPVASFSEL